MNPLTWQREHQVALLLAIVLGIVLGFLSASCTRAFTMRQWRAGTSGAAFDGESWALWSVRA